MVMKLCVGIDKGRCVFVLNPGCRLPPNWSNGGNVTGQIGFAPCQLGFGFHAIFYEMLVKNKIALDLNTQLQIVL